MIDHLQLAEDLNGAETPDVLWNRTIDALGQFGIGNMLYGRIATKADFYEQSPSKSVFLRSDYPEEFIDNYLGLGKLHDDLSARRALENQETTFWHHDALWEDATPEQIEQASFESDLGMEVGLTMPLGMFSSERLGGLSIWAKQMSGVEFDRM